MKLIPFTIALLVCATGCVSTRPLDLSQGTLRAPLADVEHIDGTVSSDLRAVVVYGDSLRWRSRSGRYGGTIPVDQISAIITKRPNVHIGGTVGLLAGGAFGFHVGSHSDNNPRPGTINIGPSDKAVGGLGFALLGGGLGALIGRASYRKTRYEVQKPGNVE